MPRSKHPAAAPAGKSDQVSRWSQSTLSDTLPSNAGTGCGGLGSPRPWPAPQEGFVAKATESGWRARGRRRWLQQLRRVRGLDAQQKQEWLRGERCPLLSQQQSKGQSPSAPPNHSRNQSRPGLSEVGATRPTDEFSCFVYTSDCLNIEIWLQGAVQNIYL